METHMQHLNGSINDNTELYTLATNLVDQAKLYRERGDLESYDRIIKATVGQILKEGHPRRSGIGDKVKNLLEKGWCDVHTLTLATGLSQNRVHMLLTHFRSRGMKVQSKTIKKYRIVK
jgi:hypothetical protein